jgi:hypothetical protein
MHKKTRALSTLTSALFCITLISSVPAYSQSTDSPPSPPKDSVATGVAVSPGVLKFSCKPGGTESHIVKVSNTTNKPFTFQITFNDYVQNTIGQPLWTGAKAPKSKFALSTWATVSPSLFTVAPGQTQKITVTVSLPEGDSLNHASWTVLGIDQVHKKAPVDLPQGDKTVNMGVVPSMGFGVYLYNNPPNVKSSNMEIQAFSYHDTAFSMHGHDTVVRQLYMKATNTGDGLCYCISYAEVTNLQTGKTIRLGSKQITVLPGYTREFVYNLPKDMPINNYSAVGVIYFGDKAPKKVAKLNFTIH